MDLRKIQAAALAAAVAAVCAADLQAQEFETGKDARPDAVSGESAAGAGSRGPAIRTLSEMLLRLQERSPQLRQLLHERRSAEAEVRQAAVLPNPVLLGESENISGTLDGVEESESSLVVSQKIELGGKRRARIARARAAGSAAAVSAELGVLKLLNDALRLYARVETLQDIEAAAKTLLDAAEKASKTVQRKVDAGATLSFESAKARIAVREAALDSEHVGEELAAAREALCALWAGTSAELGMLEPLPLKEFADELPRKYVPEGSLRYRAVRQRELTARKEIAVQKSLAVPDITLRAGYRRLEESGENTFVGGFSIPLPLFNRNKGAIHSAREHAAAKKFERQAAASLLAGEYAGLVGRLEHLLEEQEIVKSELLPDAELVLADAREAYSLGRTSYLNLFDSRETLYRLRRRSAEVRHELASVLTALSDLSGAALVSYQENSE